jgi:hypothetical protein
VVELGDELAAAALITEIDGIDGYHLAGTADAHVRASPSKLLITYVRDWAKDRGDRSFHLAGSLRRGDSLSHFKAGFSPLRHSVRSWRLICDPEAYRRLVRAWEARAGVPADAPDAFFPAYRKPGASAPRHER